MLLGVLFFEQGRDPFQLSDIPLLLWMWVQAIGPFALAGMVLLLLVSTLYRRYSRFTDGGDILLSRPWMRSLVVLCLLVNVVAIIARYVFFNRELAAINLQGISGSGLMRFYNIAGQVSGLLAGVAGLVGIGVPFLYGCLSLSWQRIWALTKLSFMEGLRRRILYVFSALLVVLMFASWFISPKPEDQLKTYVQVIDLAMTPLMLFAGVLVAAFSIPADIRQQTIHTILTKPVERFEIILGRFLGYAGLMTLILLVLNLVGVIYVLRGIDPEAAADTMKARSPLYGELTFENTKDAQRGESVGREWDYRSYISGPMGGTDKLPLAVWSFPEPSATLAARDKVRCEFAFDIYRTTKGRENQGVQCSFIFTTWKFQEGNEKAATDRRKELEDQKHPDPDAQVAEEFGYLKVDGKTVVDYHTESLDIPGSLLRNARPKDSSEAKAMQDLASKGVAPLTVRVRCESPTQYLGMARYDLYLRQDAIDGANDRLWFTLNFFKGAFGLWLRLCLVIGLAVCMSTYMSGVVSLLVALLIYTGGIFREFIQQVALGSNVGGGPLESLVRLTTRTTMAAPLDQTVTTNVAQGLDWGFRGIVQTVLNLLPDIERFDMTAYVAEGFDIPPVQMLISFLVLVGYLVPWFILAYFLMKGREIASAD